MVHLAGEEYAEVITCCEQSSAATGDARQRGTNPRGQRSFLALLNGNALLRSGDLQGAIRLLSASLETAELDSSSASVTAEQRDRGKGSGFVVDTLDSLGIAHALHGELVEAEAFLRRGLDMEPRHPSSLANFGYIRQLQGRMDEALDIYDQALQVDPQCALALLRRGACYLRLGDVQRARESFWQCTELPANIRPLLSPPSLAGAAHLYLCVLYHLLNETEAVDMALTRGMKLHGAFRTVPITSACGADWAAGGKARLELFYLDLSPMHAEVLLHCAKARLGGSG